MDNYQAIAQAIVKQQESVVGPLAWTEAQKVSGILVKNKEIQISGDGKKVIEKLVFQFENLFGQASVEVCKDAVRPFKEKLKSVEIPSILL